MVDTLGSCRRYGGLAQDLGLTVTEGRRGTFVSSEITEAGTHSEVAARARRAAADFTQLARRLGLSRAEAVRLVERSWTES